MSTDETTRLDALWQSLRAALPALIATAVFAAGLWALSHLLREVDIHDVARQLRETSVSVLAIAFFGMVGSYAALIGHDWSALRYIGKTLPLRVVATVPF